jgi:hypothetical protein
LSSRRSSRNKNPRYEAAGAPDGEAYSGDEDYAEDELDSEEQEEPEALQKVFQFKDGSTLVQGEILLVEYESRRCLCEVLEVNADESFTVQFWGRITVSGRYYPSWTDEDRHENFMTDERRDKLHGKSHTLDPTANYHPISAIQIIHREITLTSGVPPTNIAKLIGTPITTAPSCK